LLFSLHDWEAPFIAAAAERFQEVGVVLGVSSSEVLKICLDKFRTFEFCKENGIKVPQTFLSKQEALQAHDKQEIAFPLIVKARYGQGSLALYKVHSPAELSAACLLAKGQIARFADNRLHADCDPVVLIQECIEGPEYGLDVVNDFEGRFRACLCKLKLGMRAGETDSAVTLHDEALQNLGQTIGQKLGHVGMLDADVIVRDGTPYLIEMNPRFGGHYPFSQMAGANVPAALIAMAEGQPVIPEWLVVRRGVKTQKSISLEVIHS
jgi:carbamoyl-phosphate synthase large subunit